MSLGIVVKGTEGIVLAADSRVTLMMQLVGPPGAPPAVSPANFDHATKLLRVTGQNHVGAVTFGLGAMMAATGPRTMQSFIPEFEAKLLQPPVRLSVQDFSQKLSDFYLHQWKTLHTGGATPAENIEFIVGGYDEGDAYGRVFQFSIPAAPAPAERNGGAGQFGMTFGGQTELVDRLLRGFDGNVPNFLQQNLSLTPAQMQALVPALSQQFGAGIPFQFLPLQDCVNLATFLIQGTISFQRFTVAIRGVGGRVDVATITPSGFEWVAQKKITSSATLHVQGAL